LLKSSSPEAQQIASQILIKLQPKIGDANQTIVDPVLSLLRSFHLEVQYEACQLIRILVHYGIQSDILKGLVSLLKPTKADLQEKPDILQDPSAPGLAAPLPVYVQQAAASKMIGIICKSNASIAESCVQLGCIHSLLVAMGNDKHPDSQKQAGITLEFFVRLFPIVHEAVREALGPTFFDEFMTEPETFYLNATPIHLDVLISNKVTFSGVSEAEQ